MDRSKTLGTVATLLVALAGCAAGDPAADSGAPTSASSGAGGAGDACVPGKTESCACPGGAEGVQSCNEDGTGFDACECGSTHSTSEGGGDPCGDGMCLGEESCHTCEADCGACAPCTIAPSCDEAMIPPASMNQVAELGVTLEAMPPDAILARLAQRVAEGGPGVRMLAAALAPGRPGEQPLVALLREQLAKNPAGEAALRRQLGRAGLVDPSAFRAAFPEPEEPVLSPMGGEFPEGGTIECGAPLLRLRVAQITVHEEDDDVANDIVYCAVVAEGGDGGEVRVTPETPNLDEGDSFQFSIESGAFWGQAEPRTPGGNLMVTYDCFEADSNDGYKNLVDGVASAATQLGGILDDDQGGWIFSVAGAVVPLVTDALVLDSDDHLFNATQIVPVDKQMELTNGAWWSVRKSGTHVWSDWDWELRVEAWGCAEYGTL